MSVFLVFLIFLTEIADGQISERESTLAPIEVFGSGTDSLKRPLEPTKVDQKKLDAYQYTDVNRALRNSSGVYSREEDGQGLRPNIGLRGTNPDRSKKIVMLQDGVLIGPAPYSAPAAYYTPSMNHVESLEIFRGFAAIPYGPNSVGGAVNFLTPSVPFQRTTEAKATFGSFQTLNLKASTGGPIGGRHGYLLQGSHFQSDGFKQLDGGGKTGFAQDHVFGKAEFRLSEKLQLTLTGGYGEEKSDETYLGISEDDFQANAYRRYSASALDKMKWQHSNIQARIAYALSDANIIEATYYRHDFHRAWHRLDRFRDSTVNLRDILNDPSGPYRNYLNILRGDTDSASLGTNGELVLANNDRIYVSQGLQSRMALDLGIGEQKHAVEVGMRIHADSISRNHTSNRYAMTSGEMRRTADAMQTDLKNRDQTMAITVTAMDNWQIGTSTLTPVVRYEDAKFAFKNELTGSSLTRRDGFWVPGLSFTQLIATNYAVRLSVNRAVTASGLSASGSEGREEAVNYELDLKHKNPERNQEFGAILFYNDYRNLTGTCSASLGCASTQTDIQFNGGKAIVAGAEISAAKGFQAGPVYFPVQANVTLVTARFDSAFVSDSPEWGVGQVNKGDPLPYVPKTQYKLSFGSEYRRFQQDLSMVYQAEVYDQAAAAGRRTIPAYGIVDWTASYQISKQAKLTAKVDNILAREYAVSARPFGLRPGKPQSFQVGCVYTF